MTCVVIEVDEAGKVSVGALPQDQKPDYGDLLHPVGSVDEALTEAKELLGGSKEAPNEEQAENEMQQGFAGSAGGHAMMGGGY